LFAQSIKAAENAEVINRRSLEHVVLDFTVQPKAVPTTSTGSGTSEAMDYWIKTD
jgi:hypothetical protein